MHQENLWSTAPKRTAITSQVGYIADRDEWYISINFHQSKANERSVAGSIQLPLENDEMDVVPYLYNTAFRAWDSGTDYIVIKRLVVEHLRSYRETGISCPGHINTFRSVSFG